MAEWKNIIKKDAMLTQKTRRKAPDPDCEECGGTGEVRTMEQVYPNEPHMADIGSQPCICTIVEDDGDDYDPDR
jgi:hypothetical protein